MKSGFASAARAFVLGLVLGTVAISPAPAQSKFEPAKLEAFAIAAVRIDTLGREWVLRIQNATSEDAATQMRQQARSELASVIEKTEGITLDEYKEIARAAQNDPDLRSQLEAMMQAKLGN